MKNLLRFAGLSAGAILYCHSISALGATHTITISGFSFSPATLTINAGDSVTWSGLSGHTSTSGTIVNSTEMANGLWSGSVNGFTVTFTNTGTFPYYCIPHGVFFGMKGTITVNAAANVRPTVTMTNPVNGIMLSAPASMILAAQAADSDGSVTNVKFLQGTTTLGNVPVAPFSIPVNGLSAADYTFSAIASDNGGLTDTNSIIVHVVNAIPVTIGETAFSPPKNFQFNYSANPGLTYVVQVSSNLLDWNPLTTNKAAASPVVFTDTNAAGNGSFYRVGLMPNP